MPNFKFRLLGFSLLILSILFISSCDSKVTVTNNDRVCEGKPGTGVAGDCSSTSKNSASPSPSAAPIKYSILCFAQNFYSSKCQNEYYKIPEGVNIEVYLEKTGGGISENIGYVTKFRASDKQETISKSESDALVNSGAVAYSIAPLHVRIFDSSTNEFISVPALRKAENAIGGTNINFTDKVSFTTGDSFKIVDSTCGYYPCKITELVPYELTSTVDTKESSSSQESSHPSAAEFIQKYYQLLNERNYSNAWSQLSTNFKQKSKDYIQWWDKVKNIRVENVKSISQNENAAIVEAQISYELKDGRLKQDGNKQIHLLWNRAKNEWEIDK
jgi:hypothetical protein